MSERTESLFHACEQFDAVVGPDAGLGRSGREMVLALDLHKERIRRLQEALCECQQRDQFQADLHDELCPVYVIAEEQRREYEPRV